ncbi:MAG: HD-GYP domain-containing protein [Clostridia bacterium]
MRYVSIEQVEPGDILFRSIYTSDGLTLLQTDMQLTVGMINKLRRFGVTMLYIKDPLTDDVKLEEVVSESTRKEAVSNLSKAMQCVQTGKAIDLRGIQKTTASLIDELMKNRRVMVNLTDIRTNDNHLFIHSLNVCMMSTVIGISLGYNQNQLKELAMGALLHDIGKVSKDEEDASNRELGDQHHSWTGFNLLRRKYEMSIVSAHVALQHHEWVNGKGMPRGLTGPEIHDFAKITAIANYYDNLISPFSAEEETLMPFEACEKIMALANYQFDHDMVIRFLRSIATYPTGSSVKLSTGEIGVVIDQNRGLPTRPVVRVIRRDKPASKRMDEEHEVLDIDLSEETTIFITGVLT